MEKISYRLEGFEGPLDLLLYLISKNKLNIYYGDKVYQIKGSERFNALKYMNFYYRYKNLTEEVEDGKFLGL